MSDGGAVVKAPEGTAQGAAEAFAESSPESSRSRTIVWQDPVPIAVTMWLWPIEIEPGRVAADSGKLLAHGIATSMILS